MDTWLYRCMAERTSVQLDRDTKDLLDRIKREKNAKSYAQAIRMLAKEAMKLRSSEVGSLPRLKPFRRDQLDRLD
jgi:hypothetical protein